MRITRNILAVAAVACLALVAGCDTTHYAPKIKADVPDIVSLQSTSLGKVLASYGYTPVDNIKDKSKKVVGQIWVACGKQTDLTECGNNLHNEGTEVRPNLYVAGTKVVALEGPTDGSENAPTYYAQVPDIWTDSKKTVKWTEFAKLTKHQRALLLGIMPTIKAALKKVDDDTVPQVIKLPELGLVVAKAKLN